MKVPEVVAASLALFLFVGVLTLSPEHCQRVRLLKFVDGCGRVGVHNAEAGRLAPLTEADDTHQ